MPVRAIAPPLRRKSKLGSRRLVWSEGPPSGWKWLHQGEPARVASPTMPTRGSAKRAVNGWRDRTKNKEQRTRTEERTGLTGQRTNREHGFRMITSASTPQRQFALRLSFFVLCSLSVV